MARDRVWRVDAAHGAVVIQVGDQVLGREGTPGAYVRHLVPIARPNGRLYRPRKIVVQCWENDDTHSDSDPHYPCGVVVLGTRDVAAAQPLADEWCRYWHGSERAAHIGTGWYRLGYAGRGGPDLTWLDDEVHGRAGLTFAATDAPPLTADDLWRAEGATAGGDR